MTTNRITTDQPKFCIIVRKNHDYFQLIFDRDSLRELRRTLARWSGDDSIDLTLREAFELYRLAVQHCRDFDAAAEAV